MHRLAYRNLGDHESLVVTHTVAAGDSSGVRWYELRSDPQRNPVVYQQGTYAPDSAFRWLSSAAMDQSGGIGVLRMLVGGCRRGAPFRMFVLSLGMLPGEERTRRRNREAGY